MGKTCGNIVDKYKNTEHNTTKIKPLDAVKNKSFMCELAFAKQCLKNRKYTKSNEGDMVRVNIKRIGLLKVMNRTGVENDIK